MTWLHVRSNQLRVRTNWLKFIETSGELTHHLGRIDGMYLKIMKRNRKVSTCNRLDLETLGSCPIMPKNSSWTLAGGAWRVQRKGGPAGLLYKVLCIWRPDYSHRPCLNTFDGPQYLQYNAGWDRFGSAPRAPPGHMADNGRFRS
jgi:hypothetical protein